mmetsp:Transcript_896/g.1194  ORF Transcript_896/g.1194 Transcript_896/m.1194 type:complete len:101 (-) Transcript_896:150-452(-)
MNLSAGDAAKFLALYLLQIQSIFYLTNQKCKRTSQYSCHHCLNKNLPDSHHLHFPKSTFPAQNTKQCKFYFQVDICPSNKPHPRSSCDYLHHIWMPTICA